MNPNDPQDPNTDQTPEPFTPPSFTPESPVVPLPPVDAPEPILAPPVVPQAASDPGKVLAIVGLVLAFVGLSLIGLILAIVAKVKSSKAGFKNVLAVVAIVINSIFLLVTPVLIAITIVAYAGIQDRAKDAQTNAELNSLKNGVLTYISEKSTVPANLSEAATTAKLDKSVLTDSEGKAYTLTWEPAGCSNLFTCTSFTLSGDSAVNEDEKVSIKYDAATQQTTTNRPDTRN